MMIQIKAPHSYYNEYGLLSRAGELIAQFGKKIFIITGKRAFEAVKDSLVPSLEKENIRYEITCYGGKTTADDIAALGAQAKESGAAAVLAAGGGKVMDLSKAAAEKAGLPVITAPSVASNCAAYTSLSVVYNEAGGHAEYRRLDRAPSLILVDAEILRRAPKRFTAAGMGDTLAKWLEAYNFFGGSYKSVNETLGVHIARMAWDLMFSHYKEAYALAGTAVPGAKQSGAKETDLFSEVLDGVFFLAGLIGSIRGGKHVAAYVHPLSDAFTHLPESHENIHGEVVSFANAVQLSLFRQDDNTVQEILSFNRDLGLPLSLDDLGFAGKDPEETSRRLSAAFEWSETAQDTTTPFAVEPGKLEAAILKTHYLGTAIR